MKAFLKNYRQTPRKTRLVTDLVKGRSVIQADALLSRLVKRGALPIRKLLLSAVANSKKNKDSLYVKSITVDKGPIMKRSMPRAMGRAFPIHKHTSHVTLTLSETAPRKK